ncbi:MAG: BatA and WFA domain-containing protein [Deltaproteobacteria bacterium]|nr:BatA and WFA domain-containing protein [Deltaproteobacteria bacterium]
MQLLSPIMLSALAVIPVLILIHTLKQKPTPVEVTNLFLWQEVLREKSRHLTFQRLVKNLPLLLQILIVMLVSLAVAEPVWFYWTAKQGDIILVLDTSASMKTKRSSGIRLDAAKTKALEVIDRSAESQKILIVEAASEPRLKTGFTADKTRARAIVQGLEASDAPGNLKQAVLLAASFIDPSSHDQIYLLTDGAGVDLSKITTIHPKIIPVIITGGKTNIGITKFEFRQEFFRNNSYEILLEVKNFGQTPKTFPIRLSVDRTVIFNSRVHLQPLEKKTLILPYSGLITGMAKALIDIDDDLPVDNAAYLSLNSAQDIWVLLVSRGNYFLKKLLQAHPNFMVNTIRKIVPTLWKEQAMRHDIVIVDRMDFPATERGNFLLIDSFSPSIPISKTGRVELPDIVDWNRNSPLMTSVNVSGLTIESASIVQAGAGLKSVIESADTGLMYAYEDEGIRAVFLGFDITRSDLPLKVAFPVMMSNIINWLNPHKLQFSSLHARAGTPVSIYVSPDTEYISVRPPRGKWERYRIKSNPFIYTNTRKVGIYTVLENNKRRRFTVNLLDESESTIIASLPDTVSVPADGLEKMAAKYPLWSVCILLACMVLMIEWHVWLKDK